jgi:hypothetical protein
VPATALPLAWITAVHKPRLQREESFNVSGPWYAIAARAGRPLAASGRLSRGAPEQPTIRPPERAWRFAGGGRRDRACEWARPGALIPSITGPASARSAPANPIACRYEKSDNSDCGYADARVGVYGYCGSARSCVAVTQLWWGYKTLDRVLVRSNYPAYLVRSLQQGHRERGSDWLFAA